MPLDLSAFNQTGYDEHLPGGGGLVGILNEVRKRKQLEIAQDYQRRMAEAQLQGVPVEQDYRRALTEQALATAEKYRKDTTAENETRYADKIAKLEQARNLEKNRNARGMLEAILSRYDIPGMDSGPELDNLIASNSLKPDVERFLTSNDRKDRYYTKNAIAGAIAHLGTGDPLYMGQKKVETQQAGATERNEAQITSREKEGAANRANKLEIQQLKNAHDSNMKATGLSTDKLIAFYTDMMRKEEGLEGKLYWRQLAEYATNQLAKRNPSAGTSDIDLGRLSKGEIPTKPRVTPVEPPGFTKRSSTNAKDFWKE